MSDLSACVSRECLVKSLRSLTCEQNVELLDYQVKRASNAVEGFTSLVLRVSVTYRLPGDDDGVKTHKFIVKTMPQSECHRQMMTMCGIFAQEWLVFSHVAPLMTKVSAGRVQVPLPSCYHGFCEENDASFYLEDLVAAGYCSVDRSYFTKGLDYAHCRVVMKSMGRLHCLSVVAEKMLDPESGGWAGSFPNFDKDRVYYVPGPDEPRCPSQDVIDGFLKNFKEICEETEGFPQRAVATGALDRILQAVYPVFCRLKQTPPQNRRVLVHGDCWMNNMMFQYKRGEDGADHPADVKFFDLQLARCSHPSTDFLYFLYMSTRKAVRETFFFALAEEYYKSFANTFKALGEGPPPFSLEEFRADLTGEYRPYGPIIGIFYSPLIMLGEDFLLPNAEDLTGEKVKDMFDSGATQKIKHRFRNDIKYRSDMVDNMMDFLNMALPYGPESVESSPLLENAVNKT